MRATILAVALAVASPLAAATLQEQYTAAQTAFDAGRMAEARTGFAAVLPRLDANPKMKTQAAIVRARMGTAATAMSEPEAGIALLTSAVAALPPKSDDWILAMQDLGLAHELAIDYAAAAQIYRVVLAAAQHGDGAWLTATIGAARTLLFSDPAAARGYADQALGVGAAMFNAKQKRDGYAQLLGLRGRIELNAGYPREARIWLAKAIVAAGGLGIKVSAADLRVRGDAGLAAFFSGDLEATRKFLAYTGAGQLPGEGFDLGTDIPLPSCAPVGNVARTDMAVIEFQIGDDGRVTGVAPVYAINAVAASEFARAVRGWSWKPEAAIGLNRFWRQAVRLELRCANRGPTASNRLSFGPASAAWVAAQGPLPDLPPVAAAALPILERELARRVGSDGPASPRLVPVLLAILASEVRSAQTAARAVASARLIARSAGAPQDLMIFLRLRDAEVTSELAYSQKPSANYWRDTSRRVEVLLGELDAEGLGQTRGAALVAFRLATWSTWANDVARQTAGFRRILAVPVGELPDGDILRQTARLSLASIEAAGSRIDAARALVAETGLSAEQCSTLPVEPQLLSSTAAKESDFPREALMWNFEGINRMAFDIDATGRPVGVRTVIASPPLIFNKASEKIYSNLRYRPVFRDGTGIACADQQKNMRYSIRR